MVSPARPPVTATKLHPSQTVAPTRTKRPTSTRPPATLTPTAFPSPFTQVTDLPVAEINNMWASPQGELWLAGTNGVFAYAAGQWRQLSSLQAAYLLGSDAGGRVWVLAEETETIAAYDGAGWRVYGSAEGWSALPDGDYLSPGLGDGLATDPDGGIWLATGSDELRHLDPATEKWEFLTAEQIGFAPADPNYQGHFLSDVELSQSGSVWVGNCIGEGEGLRGEGVRWYKRGQWTDASDTANQCVLDIEKDAIGRMWVGGFNELLQYDPRTGEWARFPLPAWDRSQLVTLLDIDPAGNPWVKILRQGGASWYGAEARYHLKDDEWVLDLDDAWDPDSLAFSADGRAWLCAGGTVYEFGDGQAEQIAQLAVGEYCQVVVDGSGRVWVGGRGGLWWLDATQD